ncbi:MAG: Peptidase M16 inactive domain protein [Syntrophus sp. PtaU1.Bin208]|nr:MAG: Peptidase M16 inactive domain protein [Syntrophus sp. PtaU1.Bin208]
MALAASFCFSGSAIAFSHHERTLKSPERLSYPPLSFQLPKAQRSVLSNGVPLHIAEDHELPLVKVTALIKMGSIHDPSGKEGIVELLGDVLLTGGTDFLSGDEIDEALAFMAADIRCDVHLEYTLLTLSVLRKDVDKALQIFSSILKNPLFEQGKFLIAKNLKIEELRRISDDPQNLAFRSYRRLIYKDDPRGRLSSQKSLDKIDRNDLLNFHKKHVFAGNILLAVSGDMTGAEALAKFNLYFGDWQNSNLHPETLPPPVAGQKGSLSLISKETPQSIIIYGHRGPGISSPDFYPFTVLDFILGSGGFQSRIFQEIRTNRGLAYSTGSFYQGRQGYGIFETYVFTKAESTIQALRLIMDLIKEIQDKEASPKELQWAINSISNNFIFSFKTADDVVFQQMMCEYKKLPRNFLEAYPGRISAVRTADVRRVASKYLDPKEAVILVVGQEQEFDAPLSHFGAVNRENLF